MLHFDSMWRNVTLRLRLLILFSCTHTHTHCTCSLLMPLLGGALLPPSVIYSFKYDAQSWGTVDNTKDRFFPLYYIKIPTRTHNIFIHSQRLSEIYYNTMIHSFINLRPSCIIPTICFCSSGNVTPGL